MWIYPVFTLSLHLQNREQTDLEIIRVCMEKLSACMDGEPYNTNKYTINNLEYDEIRK